MSEEKEPMSLASFLMSKKRVTEPGSKIIPLEMEVLRKCEKGEVLHLSTGDIISDGDDFIYTLKNG